MRSVFEKPTLLLAPNLIPPKHVPPGLGKGYDNPANQTLVPSGLLGPVSISKTN